MPKQSSELIIDRPYDTSARRGGGGGTSTTSGATTLLGLNDTPSSYAGQAGKVLAVKSAEDGAEFIAIPVTSVNGQTGVVVLDPDDLDDTATAHKFTSAAEITKLAGIEALADVTDAANIASSITGVSTDDTIVDADVWGYLTSGALVKTTWANIKAVLKTYFDTLYNLYVHPNHTGDVTSVADGATTIAADAVTNAKAANMAQGTVKGRQLAGGTGDPEDLTAAQLLTIIEAQALYALLAGRPGGQSLKGGTASGEDLTLMSTPHATKGSIFFGTSVYDEVNNRLGLRVTSPSVILDAQGSDAIGQFRRINSDNVNRAPAFLFVRARGTPGSEADITAGDHLGKIQFRGRVGGVDIEYGALGFVASDTSQNGRLVFYDYDLSTERFSIDNDTGKTVIGLSAANASVLGIKAGTSTNDAAVGGVLYVSTAITGNVTTGEDTLTSYTIPANTLAVNGQSVWYEAGGTFAANGNSKTLRVDVGGTDVLSTMVSVSTSWMIRGRITRTSSTTVICSCMMIGNAAQVGANESATVTLSGAVVLTITGEATATDDAVCNTFIVGWDDNNT